MFLLLIEICSLCLCDLLNNLDCGQVYRLPMKFGLRLLKFLKVNWFLFLLLIEKYPLGAPNDFFL